MLVDTCIWSYALRSKHQDFSAYVEQLNDLISAQRVLIIGAIKQELLSGYSDAIDILPALKGTGIPYC